MFVRIFFIELLAGFMILVIGWFRAAREWFRIDRG